MQTLVEAGLASVVQNEYSLSYRLAQPNMVSVTGYKVLQGQQDTGLLPCVCVQHNGQDKLYYDIEAYNTLYSLLGGLSPEAFAAHTHGILGSLAGLHQIGFLQPSNLETTIDKIFIGRDDSKPYLVYLPVNETFASHLNPAYEQTLKTNLLWALQNYPNLQGAATNQLYQLLLGPTATQQQLLDATKPAPPPVPAGSTAPMGGTSPISQALGNPQPPPLGDEPAATPLPQEPPKAKRSIFKRRKPEAALAPVIEESHTEVLGMLFVPSIVLACQQENVEFLIDKQEFSLGSRGGTADGKIPFSNAISRMHCKITHSDGKNYISDLGSSNGTFVNGRKLEQGTPIPVQEGDKITLANVNFVVKAV